MVYFITTILAILALLPLSGCSDDNREPSPEETPRDEFIVFTRAGNGDAASGATQVATGKELINSWVVFFILRGEGEAAGTVKEVYHSGTDISAGDDFSFDVNVPDGTYDIVAFGNMDESKVIELMGIEGTSRYEDCEGKSVKYSDIKKTKMVVANNGYSGATDRIPMSGYREGVTIKNNRETGEGYKYADYHLHNGVKVTKNVVELIRMVTKTTIKVKNTASKAITVKEIKFGVLNKGHVALLPDYSILGKEGGAGERPTIFTGDDESTETVTMAFTDGEATIAAGSDESFTFYGRESVTNHDSGKFVVKLTYSTEGVSGDDSSFWVPTGTIEWINRNDWVTIPITVSDYTVDWEVIFYPPIGGYPAVMTDPTGDEFTFYATFETEGEFEIRATIRDAERKPVHATYVPDLDNATSYPAFTFKIGTLSGDVSGDNSIFRKPPYVSSITGEILGELNGKNGHANVPVELTYKAGKESVAIVRSRNISITKK